MKLLQGLNCFSLRASAILFSSLLLTQSTFASDSLGNTEVLQTSLSVSLKDTDSNASSDSLNTQKVWSISTIEVPEPPSPLLFLAGIAVISLVRLRNKTIH
jgi:hypothetical protein